jgi:hypothetical protein
VQRALHGTLTLASRFSSFTVWCVCTRGGVYGVCRHTLYAFNRGQSSSSLSSSLLSSSRSVADGAPSVAGHSRRPAWCTATAAATAVATVVLACSVALCCALLPQPSAPQSSQINAGAGCLLAAEEALLHAPPHVPAGCAVPSTPQTCKESAPCVPRRSGIEIARRRVRRAPPAALASESPKGARSRATAPVHGTAI